MQNTAPESPRLCQALTLAGLAFALFAPVPPAAADDAGISGSHRLRPPESYDRGYWTRVESWPVRPVVIGLGRGVGPVAGDGPGSVGLAVRVDEGLSLGVAAGLDPGNGEAVGFVSFELSF